jgi:hypothetical protein
MFKRVLMKELVRFAVVVVVVVVVVIMVVEKDGVVIVFKSGWVDGRELTENAFMSASSFGANNTIQRSIKVE